MKSYKTTLTKWSTKTISQYFSTSFMCLLMTSVFYASAELGLAAKDRSSKVIEIYVAPGGNDSNDGRLKKPYATITRARDAIRTLRQKGPIYYPVYVYLRGGLYQVNEPVVFTPEDSGNDSVPITYMAYRDESPVISGGRIINGWTKGENGIWTTVIDEVKTGNWYFNQIYVNGQFRKRAHTPNQGLLRVNNYTKGDDRSFGFAPGQFNPAWKNIDDIRVILYRNWNENFLPVQSIDTVKNIVTFKLGGGGFNDDFTTGFARYIIDNIFEGLDSPGEWYLDRSTGLLSYIPFTDEDLPSVEVIAPYSLSLLTLEGDPLAGKFVRNLCFRNLSFKYTNYQLPAEKRNAGQGSAGITAAITANGMHDCTFESCTFSNLGTFAMGLEVGCQNNHILRNEFSYLGAGGIRINSGIQRVQSTDAFPHPFMRSSYNIITDNTLHHYGEFYPSAVAILLMHTNGNVISHNLIHHGYYTAISAGWIWGYMPSMSRDNIMEYNYIHDIGQGLLSDMGAFYTLGISPGTIIRNNLIHDIDANTYGGWGIYMDEGSSHILVENNIVYNAKFAAFNVHYCKEVTVRNNIFALSRIELLQRQRAEPHQSLFFENNIMYWTQGKLLSADWEEKPYTFHFDPRSQPKEMSTTFTIDYNIYYNPNLTIDSVKFGNESMTQWNARGKDVHSIFADPMFVDLAHFDFRLKTESPAFRLGFKQIDISNVGPRK